MNCRVCAHRAYRVMDFGSHALAGAFLRPDSFASERKYPLSLSFCEHCYSLQVEHQVKPERLFGSYFYKAGASKTTQAHMAALAKRIKSMKPQSVLEIGCNDGTLLKELAGVTRLVGVDPTSSPVDGAMVISEYFDAVVASEIGKFDVIVGCNVMAHVADLHGVTAAARACLADKGVFIVELHDLAKMLDGLQYDWIYHEHQYYWSVAGLAKHLQYHGLQIFDVEEIAPHAGSVRYYIGRAGVHKVTPAVELLHAKQAIADVLNPERYLDFMDEARGHQQALREIVSEYGPIPGYGASGRGNALLQYAGLSLPYIVDDTDGKVGWFTPETHIRVQSPAMLDSDVVLCLAWPYAKEIREKCGRQLIVPLPEIVVPQRLAA